MTTEVSSAGVRFKLHCAHPSCLTTLSLDLECLDFEISQDFLNSRAEVHIKSLSLEFGWSDDELCPKHRDVEKRLSASLMTFES